MSVSYERRFRRFELEYLVRIKSSSGGVIVEVDAVTKNISLCGLLLQSDVMIPCSTPVEFAIVVRGKKVVEPIRLTGSGVVVRVKPAETLGTFAVAVECYQPISQMDDSPTESHPVSVGSSIRATC